MPNELDTDNPLAFLGAEAKGADLLAQQLLNAKTGLRSYSFLLELLELEFYRFEAYGVPVSLIVFEMAGKSGKPLPPEAITTASLRLKLVTGPLDAIGHFAAGDYAILLPQKRPPEGVVVASKAMKLITACSLAPGISKRELRISFGVAGLPENGETLDHLFTATKTAQLQARQKPFPVQTWRGRPD